MKNCKPSQLQQRLLLHPVGGTAFAQEAQTNPVVSDTAVNEPALVAKSQMKPVEKLKFLLHLQ